MLKKSVLGILLILAVQSGYSNKILPGYYVNQQGDTVHCNINYNDWVQNPKTVQIQENGSMKEYSPDEIRGFGVYGYYQFESAKVTFHIGLVSGGFYPEQYSDSTETRTCFLKILDKNYYSLYSLSLPDRTYFFLGAQQKPITEFLRRMKKVNDSTREDQTYKTQFMQLFTEEGIVAENFNRINDLDYEAKQFEYLFSILNESHTGVKEVKKSRGKFHYEIFAGARSSSFPGSFGGYYARDLKLPSQIKPTFGFGAFYSIPVGFKAIEVGLNLGYYSYNVSTSRSDSVVYFYSNTFHWTVNYTDQATASNSLLYASLYGRFLFNPLDKTRFYAKLGVNYNYSMTGGRNVDNHYHAIQTGVKNGGTEPIYEVDQVNSTLMYTQKTFFSGIFGGGIQFRQLGFEFLYSPTLTIGAGEDDRWGAQRTLTIQSMELAVHYSL